MVQDRQDEFVEELPLVPKVVVEEGCCHVVLRLGQDHRESREDEVASVHLWLDLELLQVMVGLWEVFHYQESDDVGVLLESRQALLEDVSQVILLNQSHKEPEGHCLRAVHQQLADHEVHALNVVHLLVVAGEGSQDIPESDEALCLALEVGV